MEADFGVTIDDGFARAAWPNAAVVQIRIGRNKENGYGVDVIGRPGLLQAGISAVEEARCLPSVDGENGNSASGDLPKASRKEREYDKQTGSQACHGGSAGGDRI